MNKKSLIEAVVLNGPLFYMSTTALMGMSFNMEEGAGMSYKLFMVLLFIFGTFPFVINTINHKLSQKAILPLVILTIYVLVGIVQLESDMPHFLQMGCFVIPAVCIALNMEQQRGLVEIMKWLDLFLPFFAISFVFMIRNIMFNVIEGVTAYDQSASYFAATCFFIDIYLLRYDKLYCKFSFLDNRWYRTIKLCLLPFFLVVTLFSGGRGATLSIFVCLLVNVDILKKIPARYWIKGVIVVLILLLIVMFGLGKLSEDYSALFEHNYERISALIEGGSIDVSASSGRDYIWRDAFNTWSDSPLLGYGLFSYLDHFYIRPHNIFLEIMLQGGFVLLVIFLYFLLRATLKFRKMKKQDKSQIFLMPFVLYSSTMLMFSGSYWFEPFFWFCLTYIYNFKLYGTKVITT